MTPNFIEPVTRIFSKRKLQRPRPRQSQNRLVMEGGIIGIGG